MNLFELFVKIGVDDQASNAIGKIASGLGKGIQTAAKIGTAAVAVAASGITALTTSAIKNYAEYEQLVGGVETLFKENADTVQKYASEAYKTAGLSANEYMSTVTSFSASLLQSLDGDTAKAADYADRAIRDMADNANKMGTDISMIQSAYAGFAKQNYTLLDNLKLGFGGTKEEMARLVKEAAALTDVQKELGIVVNENDASFGNIVNAISVVQAKMGIMGTTSEEAAKTISGSISSMKSAWSNLVVGIADESADADALINNFVESVATVGDNLLPRIEVALGGVGKLVESLTPIIVESIPKLATTVIPPLASAVLKLISSIRDTIISNAPQLLQYGLELAKKLISGIGNSASQLGKAVKEIISSISGFIKKNSKDLLKSAVNIIVTIAEGLAESIEQLVPTIVDLIAFLANMLVQPDILLPLVNAALSIIVALGNGLIKSLPSLIAVLPTIITGLVDSLTGATDTIAQAGFDLFVELLKKSPEIIVELGKSVVGIIESIISKIGDHYENMVNIGRHLMEGLWEGLKSSKGRLQKQSGGLFDDITAKIKNKLGIKSPSRLYRDQIGKMMARGIGIGFEDEMGNLQKLINDDLDELNGDIETNMSYGSYDGIGVGASGTTISGVEINIYADQAGDSAESIADAVAVALQDLIDRRSAVYA